MAIARRLESYLQREGVDWEIVPHGHSGSSEETATAAHVPRERIAKSVLLEDERGYLLAVLPASRQILVTALERCTGRRLALASEGELGDIFDDCELGAVPPLGAAYGIPCIVDESLLAAPDVYFEAGDHENLVRMKGRAFRALVEGLPRGSFTRESGGRLSAERVRSKDARIERLDQDHLHVLSLRAFGAGLRRQPEYDKDGHTGMILVKTPELRVILEVVKGGTTLRTHVVRGPATLYAIEGTLDVRARGRVYRVGEMELAVLPRDERREIHCPSECAFLLAISPERESIAPVAPKDIRRILVVANRTVGGLHLVEKVRQRMRRGPCHLVVLCPAASSRHESSWDERESLDEAEARLSLAVDRLRRIGASVEGLIGDAYPMRAIRDILLTQEFDEILISTLPPGVSEWFKLDLPHRVERAFGIPVTHIVSPY